jgi:hypothetical protein
LRPETSGPFRALTFQARQPTVESLSLEPSEIARSALPERVLVKRGFRFFSDFVAKVVLQEVSKILRAAGEFFV